MTHAARPIALGALLPALGLGLLLLWLPLPAGSNRPYAIEFLLYSAAGLGLIGALKHLLPGHDGRARRLDVLQGLLILLWLLWLGWIALQWMPMAPDVLERWSPASASAYADATQWLGEAPVSALSVARPDTFLMGQLSLAYFVLFLVALLVQDRRARRLVVIAVILTAALQALFGLAMVFSGLELGPFGAKTQYRGSATGTFVNRNHFAGLMQIGAAMALALLVVRLRIGAQFTTRWQLLLRNMIDSLLSRNWWARLILLLLLVALIVSRSRMGNLAFAGAVLLGVSLYLVIAPGPGRWRVLLLVAIIAALDVGVVGAQLGLGELLERFRPSLATDMRLSTFADLEKLIQAWAPLGSGLGSFAYVYPAVRSPEIYAFNEHAHNDYAQFLIETGLPGFTLLALIVLLVLVRCLQVLRNRRDPDSAGLALGVLLAMFSIGLHSLTDFNLQIPANAATLVILMGLAAGQSPKPRRSPARTDRD